MILQAARLESRDTDDEICWDNICASCATDGGRGGGRGSRGGGGVGDGDSDGNSAGDGGDGNVTRL